MKKFNKFVSVLLALVMVLSLAITVSAEGETYSITINNTKTGHTYEAYQLFKGDLHDGVLSNIQWGDNATGYGELVAADVAARMDTTYTGEDKLTVADLLDLIELSGTPKTSKAITGGYEISDLEAGYYLVKDQDNTLGGKDDAYTQYIVKVVKDVTTAPKSSVPSVQKKVDDINDSNNSEDAVKWEDSADYDIGDAVPFQLKATLAANVSAYLKYKVVFHDTMSAGLTYDAGSYKVYLGSVAEENEVTSYFTPAYNETTGNLTFTCENVKAFDATDNSVIIVEFTATLNENAEIGYVGNPNHVYLEYSNNPNWGWDKWEDKDDDGEWDEDETPKNPDNPNNPNGDETGKTPEDKVIVFTYKVIVNKVDEAGEELPGAGFTLYKWDDDVEGEDKWVAVGEELTGEALTTFEWKGLDDGNYKLVETTTPDGYNTIEDILFTISAEHDLTWEEEAQTAILTKLEGGNKFTGDVETGALTGEVENKTGTVLPETGGMGTTLFYTVGGLLVAAAVVLLITKKRMSANA